MSNPSITADTPHPSPQIHMEGNRFTHLETTLDKVDDSVQSVAGNVARIQALYAANSATFSAAYKALNDTGGGIFIRDLLEPVKKVLDALNVVAQANPWIGIAVTAFKLIVDLEIERRSNDRRIEALIFSQTDMMSALLELRYIKDVGLAMFKSNGIPSRFQRVLQAVKMSINECGLAMDTYKKQKFLGKFFRSKQWKDKFENIAKGLLDHKVEITFALQANMALGVDQIQDGVSSVNVKLDMVIDLLRRPTPQEEKMESELRKLGDYNIDTVREREDLLRQLAPLAAQYDATTTEDVAGDQSKKKPLERSLLDSVQLEVDVLIEQNRSYFEVKLETQTRRLQDVISLSTKRIITKLGDGPYKRVHDPDLRHIWKDMNWHGAVKVRSFVAALQDYFVDRFEAHEQSGVHSLSAIDATLIPHSPILSEFGSDIEGMVDAPSNFNEFEAEKWCLKYLSSAYLRAIAEVIDDDFSGFVKISEANNFAASRPANWTLLKWIAYWADGTSPFLFEFYPHSSYIQMLRVKVLPENAWTAGAYLDITQLYLLRYVIRDLDPFYVQDGDMLDIMATRMRYEEERLRPVLEKIHYNIDVVQDFFGKGRIETYLFPLLYLVLRRHYQIIQLAAVEILDERVFENARSTIDSIWLAVSGRIDQVEAEFKLQKLKADREFRRFGNGIYFRAYKRRNDSPFEYTDRIHAAPSFILPFVEEISLDTGRIIDPLAEAHEDVGPLSPNALDFPLQFKDLAAAEFGAERARAERYAALSAQKYIWENMPRPWSDATEFTDGDATALEDLEGSLKQLPEATQAQYGALAALELRKTLKVHWCECDSCGMDPIVGHRWTCANCKNFDYCNSCETHGPKAKLDEDTFHKETHSMVYIRDPISIGAAQRRRQESTTLFAQGRPGRACDGPCGRNDVSLIWYACFECDYYRCEDCFKEQHPGSHDTSHHILKIKQRGCDMDARETLLRDERPEESGTMKFGERLEKKIEQQFNTFEKRFNAFEAAFEARFSALEEIIKGLKSAGVSFSE
ncbi:hypothetical protein BOTBODRAFT_188858 [Botryobasidium botryosum FD-172 SS1]|uniref:ZZ-type domain-containing protein n=1 Tax=Botryobasidium botryosum (strain FD-172 SS1) TaxID=930990 RepID=A0A067MAT8_BOTB1|nr:hypothetical protein BOTBODRAFT_188858 [Botryobasidium botryosum FD-172 SS1]